MTYCQSYRIQENYTVPYETQSIQQETISKMNTNLEVETEQPCKYIFRSEEEMKQNLARLCYGNLYVIGCLWVEGMKKVMVGKQMCVVPKVNAVDSQPMKKGVPDQKPVEMERYLVDCVPEKPPKMKYSDLPIYHSPHSAYKDYQDSQYYCPEYRCKKLHMCLCPYVRRARISAQRKFQESKEYMSDTLCVLQTVVDDRLCGVKEYMRSPENCVQAKLCVALSTATGVLLGSRIGCLRAFFYGGIGALASGWLCFPKETDVILRRTCYHSWCLSIKCYNLFAIRKYCVKPRHPCPGDFQPCPVDPCEKKPPKPISFDRFY